MSGDVKLALVPSDELVEAVANALEITDFGWSIRLTKLVDGVETWSLHYGDTGETLTFDERDDASAHLARRKKEMQAAAVINALAASPSLPTPDAVAQARFEEGYRQGVEAAAKAVRATRAVFEGDPSFRDIVEALKLAEGECNRLSQPPAGDAA